MTNVESPAPAGKTEAKVKAATYAAFAVSLLAAPVLEWTSTDLIPALPNSLNWAVPIAGAALTSAITWVSGYMKRTRPDSLSQSTVDAVQRWLRERLPRQGGVVR
jgi:predicted cation transporter